MEVCEKNSDCYRQEHRAVSTSASTDRSSKAAFKFSVLLQVHGLIFYECQKNYFLLLKIEK